MVNGLVNDRDRQVKQAISRGANIMGYLHWSFMDDYEWLENYRPEAKVGLFSIDRSRVKGGQLDFKRQRTKGTEALELIMKSSLLQNKDGIISDSAIV